MKVIFIYDTDYNELCDICNDNEQSPAELIQELLDLRRDYIHNEIMMWGKVKNEHTKNKLL